MELPNIGRAMPSMEVEDIEPTLKACASMEGALRVKAVLKEPALNALEHTRQRALSCMELVLFDHAHGPPAEPSTVAVPAGCVRAGDRGADRFVGEAVAAQRAALAIQDVQRAGD